MGGQSAPRLEVPLLRHHALLSTKHNPVKHRHWYTISDCKHEVYQYSLCSFGTGISDLRGPNSAIVARDGCQAPYHENDGAYEGHYIVAFAEGYTLDDHFKFLGGTIAVEGTLNEGYYTSMADDLLAKVRSDCNVTLVEDDTLGDPFDSYDPPDDAVTSRKRGSQPQPEWALRYLSADVKPPSDDVYDYLDDGGSGVDIYVFDSGINHLDEFMTADGTDRVMDELDLSDELSFQDTSNHGTRVATAIGGATRGIARAATLRSVKFSRNGKPDSATFADALQEITRRHNRRSTDPAFRGSVCNFSHGMRRTDAANKAINSAAKAGISMVGSAGNSGYQTVHFPSDNPYVISVGAMQEDYKPWKLGRYASNYGRNNVAIWAPGDKLSLFENTGELKAYTSGTSFACGYVTGIFAIFYGNEDLNYAEVDVRASWNADEYMEFPEGTDWKNSVNSVANTGYRKGQRQDPPVPYIGAPPPSS